MTTAYLVPLTLAAIPVFVVAMSVWWQAEMDPGLDADVDPRFLAIADRTNGTPPPVERHTVSWPALGSPDMATAAR